MHRGRRRRSTKATKLKVCLVSGSFEYKSDDSLIAFQKYLEANFAVSAHGVREGREGQDARGVGEPGIVRRAIFFTRRLQIDGAALDAVKKYVEVGQAPHRHPHREPRVSELAGDGQGGVRRRLQGALRREDGLRGEDREQAKDHPVLKGVAGFKSNGSLYKNPGVAPDVTVLLTGSIPDQSEPVAWVREKDGRRIFYTSLGHPDDFKDENFTRLLVNALGWATKDGLKK